MAGSEGDKDEIAKGMAEAGKDQAKPGAGTRGEPGRGADPAGLTEGMSRAGSEGSGEGPEERPNRPRDEVAVDDAIDDSFPASDPPAWTSDTGAGSSKGG